MAQWSFRWWVHSSQILCTSSERASARGLLVPRHQQCLDVGVLPLELLNAQSTCLQWCLQVAQLTARSTWCS